MWQIKITAWNKKDAASQLANHPQVKVVPSAILGAINDCLLSLEKPLKDQAILVETSGHSSSPCDWNQVVMHVSVFTPSKE